jgi:transposase
VLNAIRYMTRSGGGWRMLPKDFPPWQTVYWWFRRFVRLMLFRTIHDIALMMDRERAGREARVLIDLPRFHSGLTARLPAHCSTTRKRGTLPCYREEPPCSLVGVHCFNF